MNTTIELIEDIRAGKMVILMDDEHRENEGDLVMAASLTRAEDINFMASYGRGLICLTLTHERCQQLRLPLRSIAACARTVPISPCRLRRPRGSVRVFLLLIGHGRYKLRSTHKPNPMILFSQGIYSP